MSKYTDPNKAERNRKRLALHNYGPPRRQWTVEQLQKFIDLNGREWHGGYKNTDHGIAYILKCSLASVQYLCRKANILRTYQVKELTPDGYVKLMQMSEDGLRKLMHELKGDAK